MMDGASVVCFGETKSGLGEVVSWLLFWWGGKSSGKEVTELFGET